MIDCVMHYTVYTVYGIAYGRRNACFYAAASVTAYVDYECVLFHAFQVASIDDVILAGDIPKYSIDYDIVISELFTKKSFGVPVVHPDVRAEHGQYFERAVRGISAAEYRCLYVVRHLAVALEGVHYRRFAGYFVIAPENMKPFIEHVLPRI